MSSARMLLRTERYTEGIVVDRDGTLFFSMTNLGTISRFRPGDAKAELWAHIPDANGHKIDVDGTHVVMSSTGAILRLDASGRVVNVVASRVAGRWLTYPNDVSLDMHRGGFYVTDSGYKSTPTTMPADPQGRVYRADPDQTMRQVAGGIAYSNGVALSRDGKLLYVSESTARRLWSYEVRDNGDLGNRRLLADVPATNDHTVPDGITLGPGERLYLANHGDGEVMVYAPDGTLEQRLDAGNKATSHVAFSPDERTMYVSGAIEREDGAGAIFEVQIR